MQARIPKDVVLSNGGQSPLRGSKQGPSALKQSKLDQQSPHDDSRMTNGSRLNATSLEINPEGMSPRNKRKKNKLSGLISPQERNKMRGVSFEGITREYRDKILVRLTIVLIFVGRGIRCQGWTTRGSLLTKVQCHRIVIEQVLRQI